jgi:TRAP-type C4-dicarboxylate transport system permease small subunit
LVIQVPRSTKNGCEKKVASMLERITRGIQRIVYPASSAVSIIGMITLILMILLTIAEVIARRFFNSPITGVLSLSSLGLVVFVFLTLAYCAAKGGHVELGIITSLFPKRVQAGIASIMYILTSGILGVAGWQLWLQAIRVQKAGQTYGNLEIVIFPFFYIAALGTFLIALVYLVFFLNSLNEVRK